jgi:hypothetical protein
MRISRLALAPALVAAFALTACNGGAEAAAPTRTVTVAPSQTTSSAEEPTPAPTPSASASLGGEVRDVDAPTYGSGRYGSWDNTIVADMKVVNTEVKGASSLDIEVREYAPRYYAVSEFGDNSGCILDDQWRIEHADDVLKAYRISFAAGSAEDPTGRVPRFGWNTDDLGGWKFCYLDSLLRDNPSGLQDAPPEWGQYSSGSFFAVWVVEQGGWDEITSTTIAPFSPDATVTADQCEDVNSKVYGTHAIQDDTGCRLYLAPGTQD